MAEHNLRAYPVLVELGVAWGDMDAFQHVNNVMYFRYFETVRIAYFERLAQGDPIGADGIGPILASTSCRYRVPLTYPDRIQLGARVSAVADDRFHMEYAVFSVRRGTIAAVGEGVIVAFNYKTGKKAPLPEAWRTRIAEVEGMVPPLPPGGALAS